MEDLSPSEMELICGLDLEENTEAQMLKKDLSRVLHHAYKNGEHINSKYYCAKDKSKAIKYGHIADVNELEQETLFRAQSVYLASRRFNDARLLLLRTQRVLNALGETALNCTSQILSITGMSYLLRFIFDLGVILKHGFSPEGDHEKALSYSERFSLAWNRDGRKFRMRNDAVWFVVNASGFVLAFFTGGITKLVSKGLGLMGFGFDVGHEYSEFSAVKKQENLMVKIENHIKEIDDNIDREKKVLELKYETLDNLLLPSPESSLEKNNKINKVKSDINDTLVKQNNNYKEKQKYTHMLTQLNSKTTKDRNLRRYIVGATAVLFVAMTAIYLWPAYLTLFAIAAGAALISGSIVNGFGRRLYNGFKELFSSKQKPVEVISRNTTYKNGLRKILQQPNYNTSTLPPAPPAPPASPTAQATPEVPASPITVSPVVVVSPTDQTSPKANILISNSIFSPITRSKNAKQAARKKAKRKSARRKVVSPSKSNHT
ncbi:MAG: hypothetical protein P4M12_06770 [Gammaproteobacteria bacterium]|nr:hypothetical protein [Gammaproteobacteria bacterium]